MGQVLVVDEFNEEFSSILKRMPAAKAAAFSVFCAQSLYSNIDVYAKGVGFPKQLTLDKRLDEIFWRQLVEKNIDFPYDYQDIEDSFLELIDELSEYPRSVKNLEPNGIMLRSAVYSYISASAFFCGRGDVERLLTAVQRGVEGKIQWTHLEVLRTPIAYSEYSRSPIFERARAELSWVIGRLNNEQSDWASIELIREIQDLSKKTDAFVVPEIYYAD